MLSDINTPSIFFTQKASWMPVAILIIALIRYVQLWGKFHSPILFAIAIVMLHIHSSK